MFCKYTNCTLLKFYLVCMFTTVRKQQILLLFFILKCLQNTIIIIITTTIIIITINFWCRNLPLYFFFYIFYVLFFKATEVVIAHIVATHQHLQSWGEKSLLTEWEIGVKLFSFRFLTISFKYYKKNDLQDEKTRRVAIFPNSTEI